MKYRLLFPPKTEPYGHKMLDEYSQQKPKDIGPYEVVYEGDLTGRGFDLFDNPMAQILEFLWQRHNVGDGGGDLPFTPRPRAKEIRSMCIGDIVEINNEYWVAMSSGFEQLLGTDIPEVKT